MRNLKTFKEINDALKPYIPNAQKQRGAYTLERMQELLQYLGNPQHEYKVIHLAGTSGKTSTAYYITSMLKTAGVKVGLTVSPHVDEINERVQIDLKPLPEAKFTSALSKFIGIIDKSGVKPTYFELLVAFAYWQFAQEKVEYAVVEAGLGGLLDGTNVVERADKIAVVTDIGLDHTEVLGKTLPEIASQKAGIIHPDNVVFMHQQSEEVMAVFREVAEQQHAELHEIMAGVDGAPRSLPLFQRRNWHLAHRVYEYVQQRDGLPPLAPGSIENTAETYVPARMETIEVGDKILIMDGAHNAQKLETLLKSISAKYPHKEIAVLLSLKHTKGVRTRTSVSVITKKAHWLGLTSFSGSQDTPYESVEPAKIAEYCHVLGFDAWEIVENPEDAFKTLLKRTEPILLATGSFYLLNHIRPVVKRIIRPE